jgi:hypothetical protein
MWGLPVSGTYRSIDDGGESDYASNSRKKGRGGGGGKSSKPFVKSEATPNGDKPKRRKKPKE